MNIATAMSNAIRLNMVKTGTGAFTQKSYQQAVQELTALRDKPNALISVSNVQHNERYCYTLFGDGSVMLIACNGAISSLTTGGL